MLQETWLGVLHPDLEAALAPAFAVMGDTPLSFKQFCDILDARMDTSRPTAQLYLLTKVRDLYLALLKLV